MMLLNVTAMRGNGTPAATAESSPNTRSIIDCASSSVVYSAQYDDWNGFRLDSHRNHDPIPRPVVGLGSRLNNIVLNHEGNSKCVSLHAERRAHDRC